MSISAWDLGLDADIAKIVNPKIAAPIKTYPIVLLPPPIPASVTFVVVVEPGGWIGWNWGDVNPWVFGLARAPCPMLKAWIPLLIPWDQLAALWFFCV